MTEEATELFKGGTSAYNVIYIMAIRDEAHAGLVKVGDTSLASCMPIDALNPNCSELNKAARARINGYTRTAGIEYELLHTELAVKQESGEDGEIHLRAFRDYDVHAVLENSGHHRKKIGDTTGIEWFCVDLSCAKDAIHAVKKGHANLSGIGGVGRMPVVFRQEQKDAIDGTVKRFKKADRYLWNAKMRFGKTLSALEVVRRCGYCKTIIITHRPVVDEGWFEDFQKIFHEGDGYLYGSLKTGYNLERLVASGEKFIYFASIQDLRGSKRVGGKFDKNDDVFDTVWDLVIVDEAHEGTQTALGDATVKEVVKCGGGTKFLALSGTPFNIIGDYSNEDVYSWDYIMEQEMKSEWDKLHFGDHNPYSDLPELRIYTYDLGKALGSTNYISFEDKAFNFREYFRTWTGDAAVDHEAMPVTAKVGDFVHEQDVLSFLNLMTTPSDVSAYPFSNVEYRDMFKHTFWVVPGVKEALALQRLLETHPIFGNGAFDVINVAGNGNPDDPNDEALSLVKERIAAAGQYGYTITISCGKLTTGVTVKEWTACFMLSGSYSTSASTYLQTIFRVQSPCQGLDGKIKKVCYVFDFAPDRTLKMIARAASISAKAGKTKSDDKQVLGKFLNYCPVISISGSEMREYKVDRLLQQLKRAYAERVARNGFEDPGLYNDELLKLDELDLKKFEQLKKVVGSNKAQKPLDGVVLNDQGLTEEEYEKVENLKKKKKAELTPEEKAFLEEKKAAQMQRRNAISILNQISVRMPLLIYGAEIPYEEEVTLDRFLELIDESSWEEFMPKGVTKEVFEEFKKYYDEDVFIAAGRHIRNQAIFADSLAPTERTQRIALLFSCFKNPDKETVLTPWRVVNMHMSGTLGGWCFWDDEFAEERLNGPVFIDRGEVTQHVFDDLESKVLEINSKTGLYPLYIVYSMFRERCGDEISIMPIEEQRKVWNSVVAENVYVVCKTPMSKAITRRTLVGYSGAALNAHYFDDLVNIMENKAAHFMGKVSKPSYWKKVGTRMEFSAIVGNPPYQIQSNDTRVTSRDIPIYNHFVETAFEINPQYVSLIIPSKWMAAGLGLGQFRERMLGDRRMAEIHDFPSANDVFPAPVEIKGGVCYFLWDRDYDGLCDVTTTRGDYTYGPVQRRLDEYDVFVRDARALAILEKVLAFGEPSMVDLLSVDKEFGWTSNFDGFHDDEIDGDIPLYYNRNGSRLVGWIAREDVNKSEQLIDTWKVLVPKAGSDGGKKIPDIVLGTPMLAPNPSVCTQTYLFFYSKTKEESINIERYYRTKFFRFLVSLRKITQDATRQTYKWVPQQDFTKVWSDAELYEKYGLSECETAYIEQVIKAMD